MNANEAVLIREKEIMNDRIKELVEENYKIREEFNRIAKEANTIGTEFDSMRRLLWCILNTLPNKEARLSDDMMGAIDNKSYLNSFYDKEERETVMQAVTQEGDPEYHKVTRIHTDPNTQLN